MVAKVHKEVARMLLCDCRSVCSCECGEAVALSSWLVAKLLMCVCYGLLAVASVFVSRCFRWLLELTMVFRVLA